MPALLCVLVRATVYFLAPGRESAQPLGGRKAERQPNPSERIPNPFGFAICGWCDLTRGCGPKGFPKGFWPLKNPDKPALSQAKAFAERILCNRRLYSRLCAKAFFWVCIQYTPKAFAGGVAQDNQLLARPCARGIRAVGIRDCATGDEAVYVEKYAPELIDKTWTQARSEAAQRAQEIDAKDRANLRLAGRPKIFDNNAGAIQDKAPTGTSAAAALRRLRKATAPRWGDGEV
jgi:hypothetical protein